MVKLLAIRFCLGLVLGAFAVFVVEVIGILLVVVMYGSLDEFLDRKHTHEEMLTYSYSLCISLGAGCAAMTASTLAVTLAPFSYTRQGVWRSWAMAAFFGALAGAAFGSGVSHPDLAEFETGMLLSMITGGIAGIFVAAFLRLAVNR